MNPLFSRADELSRREFVARTASGLLGIGLTASTIGNLQAAPFEGASKMRRPGAAKNVIYCYMNGGMSHLDTFDPRESSPVKPIKTSADGVRVSEYLPMLASHMHHAVVVNSLTSNQGAHEQGNYYMHTSYSPRGTIRHPSMGAWLQKFHGKTNTTLPGSVVLGAGNRHPGAGFFEPEFQPLQLGDASSGIQNVRLSHGMSESDMDYRLDLANRLDKDFSSRYNYRNVTAYGDMYREALKMMRSEDLAAFDLNQESDSLKEEYGADSFGLGCLLARRLVEHGVRFVEVNLGGWDTHTDNFIRVEEKTTVLDRGLAALLGDLDRRGMLADTMVVLATEFGRTPIINQNNGRDHYPKAFSGVLFGGGVKGGQVYGKTNETGSEVVQDKVNVTDFNATIAYSLGLPLDHVLYSPSKRPFTVSDKGQPLASIF